MKKIFLVGLLVLSGVARAESTDGSWQFQGSFLETAGPAAEVSIWTPKLGSFRFGLGSGSILDLRSDATGDSLPNTELSLRAAASFPVVERLSYETEGFLGHFRYETGVSEKEHDDFSFIGIGSQLIYSQDRFMAGLGVEARTNLFDGRKPQDVGQYVAEKVQISPKLSFRFFL